MEELQLGKLVTYYFNKNCSYEKILDFLSKKHNVKIFLSPLNSISTLALKRKNYEESDLKDVCFAVVEELLSYCGYNLGYRAL